MPAPSRHLKKHVRGIDKVVLSVHCHNDLGLAVANSLAAVARGRPPGRMHHQRPRRAGRQLRPGRNRHGRQDPRPITSGSTTGINTQRLCPTSRLVSHVTGIQVQRNKAIVGQNAFAHEAGIHQDGMLKDRTTYEIMNPEDVGLAAHRAGPGQAQRPACPAPARRATSAITSTTQQLQKVFDGFKVLADRKKEIYDADIEALAEAQIHTGPALWTLEAVTCNAGSATIPSAAVCLWHQDGTIHRDASVGDGPVDAVFKAIERITGIEVLMRDYRVRSVTVGEDAQGEAQVEAEYNGRTLTGRASAPTSSRPAPWRSCR